MEETHEGNPGAVRNVFLNITKALWAGLSQTRDLSLLRRREVRGEVMELYPLIILRKKLAKPRKHWSSFTVLGCFHSQMACYLPLVHLDAFCRNDVHKKLHRWLVELTFFDLQIQLVLSLTLENLGDMLAMFSQIL